MFNTEIGIIGRLDGLVDMLNDVTDELWDRGQDLDTFFEDFLTDENMLKPENADSMFNAATRAEREMSEDLARFDRLLNRVLAERRKLGNFNITL